ncbi:MAG: signal recognition particle protein [Succinivibrionaceae bacterium]|nr:signal recognition particle protein [Succinivibrionaceae bacterium]
MFENLTHRLTGAFRSLTGKSKITEDNIKDALREVRMALLEADVALPVVRSFIASVKERAMGVKVGDALDPSQQFFLIVKEELTKLMGETCEELNLRVQPPAIVLMAGLQGAGKTTTVAKLAKHLKDKHKKKIMVVSCDVYRPAAIKQLETLAKEVGVDIFPSNAGQKPADIAKDAVEAARKGFYDVLLVDTAGRLHVDEEMMEEIKLLHSTLNPVETLFVVDAMTGQDAANTASAFNDALPLTGVILTKTDGDARGGAALSVRQITGKPIKFMGVSEKIDGLSPFYPDRVATRIIGMGDVFSLIDDLQNNVNQEETKKLAKKLHHGKSFDFNDYLEILKQMKNMGGVANILDKLPGLSMLPEEARNQVNDDKFKRVEAIILSMTPKERANPDILKSSRKRRIAAGAGVTIQLVNQTLNEFEQQQKVMKLMSSKGGMRKIMSAVGRLGGMMPFGK